MTIDNLKGRVALITGGREGMGRATARYLAEKLANVVIVSRNETELEKTAEEISHATKNPNVTAIAGDVANTEDVRRVVESTLKAYGKIDYLFNFAGYNKDYGKISPARPTPEQISNLEKIIEVDLLGTARMVYYIEPIMRNQNFGSIITIASTPVLDTWENDLLYQTAKVGNMKMTEVIAKQHKFDKIDSVKIYCVAPGNIFNRSTYESMDAEQRRVADTEGWLDSEEHVAKVMYWLVTGKLKRKDGQIIRLDASTAPKIFKEAGEKYNKFIPQ